MSDLSVGDLVIVKYAKPDDALHRDLWNTFKPGDLVQIIDVINGVDWWKPDDDKRPYEVVYCISVQKEIDLSWDWTVAENLEKVFSN